MARNTAAGFTLTELAVVLAIVGFLLGGLMYTLSAQTEQRNFEDTRRRLEQARELILGFAIVNGRLPCPATAVSAGDESPAGGGTCTPPNNYAGWLPARAIGFQQTDPGGYALDAWGNRIRYAVSIATPFNTGPPPPGTPEVCRPGGAPPATPHFTHKDNLRANGIDCRPDDLIVCKSASGITPTTCGGGANQIMTQNLVVAIIFSTGKNGAGASGGIDETANLNGDRVFVWHTPTPRTAANGEFDDQMIWITAGELYGRMIAAGVLP